MRKHTGMIVGLAALGLLLLTVAVAPWQPWRSQERALPRPSAESGVAVADLGNALAEQRARIENAPQINARAKRKLLARLEGRSQPKRPDKPGEAARFYLRKRIQADGTFPVARYAQAAPRFRSRPNLAGVALFSAGAVQTGSVQTGALVNPTWKNIGPGNVGGRVRALLAFAGTPDDTLIAGGVSGGIWKSTDGGTSWLPKDDLMANLAVSTLAVDPADSALIYAGTGEGYDVYPDITDGERSLKRGAGIFVSTDQGESWLSMLSTVAATGTPNERDFRFVNKIVVSPNGSNTLYAATNTDLWVSTDGGDTWAGLFTQVLSGFGERAILDLAVVDKAGFDHAYLWVAGRGLYVHSFGGDPAVSQYAVGGETQPHPSPFHRGVIAIDPINAGTAYVAVSTGSDYTIQGLYKTTDYFATTPAPNVLDLSNAAAGKLNKIIFSNPLFAFARPNGLDCVYGIPADLSAYAQGWYDMAIAVDSTVTPSRIWLGGIDLFRSDDDGVTFQMASTWWLNDAYSSFTHADQHVIVFAPGYDGSGNSRMYFGNDGGIWRSDDAHGGALATDACHDGLFQSSPDLSTLPDIDYTALNNGLGITQFWHGTVATTADIAAGGTQDNGTIARNVPATGQSTNPDAWSTLAGGDGGYAFFDPTDSTTLYQAYYYIDIRRHRLGTSNGVVTSQFGDYSPRISAGINQGSAGLFINPYLLDASYPWRLYVTNDRLWVTDNAKTASPVTWRNLGVLKANNINGSALAVAPSDPQVLYVGMEDGSVVRVNCTDAVLVAGSTTGGPAGGDGAPLIAATASGPSRNGAWAVAAGLAFLLLLTARVAAGGARRPRSQMAALPLLIAALLAAGSCVSSKSTTSSSTSGGDTTLPPTQPGAFSRCNTYAFSRYAGLPGGFISSLTVHPTTPGTVFATVSTFGERHLWKSTNSGATWTALDDGNADGDVLDVGDIPDIPAHTLFIDPQNTDELYLGTDLGVLYSADGGGTWASINTNGMANVVVETLAYRAATRTLYAFTHGRGVFALTLP